MKCFQKTIVFLVCSSSQEDYRKITVEKKGETNFFTSQMIKDCMKKVITVNLHQTVKVGGDVDDVMLIQRCTISMGVITSSG